MLIGSQTPRLHAVPQYAETPWPKLEPKLKALGFEVDEWQSNILRDALGRTEAGTFAAPNALLIVPRQNGKNHVLAARQLVGLLFTKERAIHTAHELQTAMEHLRFLQRVIDDADLSDVFKFKTGNMELSIENLRTGARLVFKARSKGAARGFAGYDALYLDEAFAIQDEELAAILPTVAAKCAAGKLQMWYTSSAGMPSSTVLERFRNQCIAGAPGWAFWEWSAPEGADIADVQVWADANPAFGVRISEDYVRQNEFQAMGAEQFARERLGIWNREKAENVIAPALWTAGDIPAEDIPDAEKIALAVELTGDGRYASVALACGFGAGSFGQVLAHQEGTEWVPELVKQLQKARNVVQVVADSSGAVLGLLPLLKREGIRVELLSTNDVKAACSGLLNDIHAHKFAHTDDEALKLVATSAGRRAIGDSGGWAWKSSGEIDITPLRALTFAHFAWTRHAARGSSGSELIDIPLY